MYRYVCTYIPEGVMEDMRLAAIAVIVAVLIALLSASVIKI
jgi:hypothetical protein